MNHARRALLFTFVLALGLCFANRASAAARLPEAQGLLEFETAVKWSKVSSDWVSRRPTWVNEVSAAASPEEVGRLALELETAMGWPSVQDSWHQDRPVWAQAMAHASSSGTVARGLLQLEAATKWSAVVEEWKAARPGWVARMQALAGR